ncbi:MAG TPA: SDR family oxidoreductase [Candidatus Thermoplasmatota archaeon]|nr:SDR family oxidoreductase [Candidatus Thermoplasmatota archaeon]
MSPEEQKKTLPAQKQDQQPGLESEMTPRPRWRARDYRPAGKLEGKVALITGGDSGIGRAVALLYAKEGADVAICYLNEHEDARVVKEAVEAEGRRCVTIAGDIGDESFCQEVVDRVVEELGGLDILVNNAAEQHERDGPEDINYGDLDRIFRTNIFSHFFFTKAALPHLKAGSAILCTTSVTAYKGNPKLLDYSVTKGAIVSFVRSLSKDLVERGIRVNGVAPGPIWTPLIPASFKPEEVEEFGAKYPMGRPGQPEEVAPCFVFLASDDSSYMTGQILHPNGGEIVNG